MTTAAREQVGHNLEVLDRLVGVVERRVARGRYDSALGWAQVAGEFAAANPAGRLRDSRLERALDEVSRSVLPERGRPSPGTSGRRRVLHVLTEVHHVGGHRRMAVRWMQLDATSHSTVVVTRPVGDVPADVRAAATGGVVHGLDDRSLVRRADRLAALARDADVVVCHTHPNDPVPAVAFGGSYAGAPVVLVNHADHVFWLSAGNVALVVNLRRVGVEAAVEARGFAPDTCVLLPTPVDLPEVRLSRPEAKARLGLDPRRPVVLTLARSPKYRPSAGMPGFCEIVGPLLAAHPDAVLVAVGPDPDEPEWIDVVRRFPGQVLLPGLQSEPQPFLAAADVYVDSFPFTSITSMLEAAAHDLPVVSLRWHRGLARLLGSDGPLDTVVHAARTPEDLRQALSELLADPVLRQETGRRAGDLVREVHAPEPWQRAVLDVYRQVERARGHHDRGAADGRHEDLQAYATALLTVEPGSALLWTVLTAGRHLDRRDRACEAVRTWGVRALERAAGAAPQRHDALLVPGPSHGRVARRRRASTW